MRLDLLTYNESREFSDFMGFAVPDANSAALHRDNSLVGPQMNSDRAVAIAKAAARLMAGCGRNRYMSLAGGTSSCSVPSLAHHNKRHVARRQCARLRRRRSGRVKVRSFVRY